MPLISGNSKTPALYLLAGAGNVVLANLAAAQSATGMTFNVLEVFNTNVPDWPTWENPWFANDPSQGYTNWVAADPTNRQLIVSYSMIPQSAGSMADPLTWETAGAAGAYNSHAAALATNLVAAGLGSSVIRLGLECNGNWNIDSIGGSAPGGGTVQMRNLWAQTWAQEITAMKAVTGANFTFCWCPNAVVAGVPFLDFYPGDAYVDIIGIDAYDGFANGTQPAPSAATTVSLFGQAYGLTDITAFAVSHGKPLGLGEYGTQLGGAGGGLGDDPYYIQGIANWVNSNTVAFHSYFDSNNDNIIPLSSAYPLTLAAYRSAFASGGPPIASTGVATGVTSAAATLNGTVNPKGSATSYQFEYGTTTAYGTQTAAFGAGSGSSAVPESYSLTGLTPNTTYHYRLNATNASGTANGTDLTFFTAAGGISPFTVTASVSNFNDGGALKVFVVTGAPAAGGNLATLQAFDPGPANVPLTPAGTGSLILFGIFVRAVAALTAAASNVFSDTGAIGTAYEYAAGHYTGTVTAGVADTVGSSTSVASWNDIAAYELKSGGTIDASSPAAVVSLANSLTTASFTPPGGSVLCAVVMTSTNDAAASAITITDTSGLGLTWTRRAIVTQTGSFGGVAAIYTATVPVPASGVSGTDAAHALDRGSVTGGPVTRGQKSSLAQVAGGAGASLVVSWPVNPSAGSTILLFVQSGTPATQPTTVADNGITPATFTLDKSAAAGSGNYIYRANNITLPASGSYAVTITLPSSATVQAGGIEYAGLKSGAPDATNAASGTSAAVSTGSVTPAASGGVVFGGFSDQSGLNPETVTFTGSSPQVSEFTAVNGSTWWPFGVADALAGSAQNLTWTLGDSVAWGGIAVAYSPASASVGKTGADTAHGTERSSVGGSSAPRSADTAHGTEGKSVHAALPGTEVAHGTEHGTVASGTTPRGTEVAHGTEHGTVVAGPQAVTGADFAHALEVIKSPQAVRAADSGLVADRVLPPHTGTGVLAGKLLPAAVGSGSYVAGLPGGAGSPGGSTAPSLGAGWEVKVLAAPGYSQLLAAIPNKMLTGMQFVKQLNDAQGGSGTVTLDMDDPFWAAVTLPNGQPAHYLLDFEHLWQVWQDGVLRYEFLAETVTEQIAASGEQRVVTVTGPGALSALKWAMVAPPGFPGNITYKLDAITDGFSEVDASGSYVLDTGLWNASAPVSRITLNPAGSARLAGSPGTTILGTTAYDATNTLISAQVSPIVSPDAAGNSLNGSQVTQFYIQDTAGTGYYALIGLSATTFYCQFKGPAGVFTKTIASATQFGAAMQGTNNYAYWQITEKDSTFFFWTSGDGTNWTLQWQIVHNWSPVLVGFYFAAAYSADNTEYATITSVNSNVSVSTLAGPLYYGEPVIAAWLDQLARAQARGTVPFVTTGRLSPATDSFGNPWTDSQSVQLQNGTDLLALLQGHASMINADYIMQAGFRLQIGTPQTGSITLGTDRSSQVVFRDGYDCSSRVRTRARNQIQNLLAVINADSRTVTASNTASEASWGQREAWMQAAVQVTQADIAVVAAATVLAGGSEILSWTLQVTPFRPGRDIFGSYDVGDWVGLERPDFSAVDKVRVTAIAVQVSADGSETHELTLESYLQFLQERLTYIAGKLGGNFISAAGTTAVAGNGSITSQKQPTVFAPTLAGLGDVLLGGSAGSAPLVYDPVTGMWVPAGSANQVTGAPQPLQVAGPGGTVTIAGDGSSVTVSSPAATPPDGGLPVPSAKITTTPTGYTITDASGVTRIIAGQQPDGTITITQSGGTAPGIPDTPAVAGTLQAITVTWDGLLAGAAPLSDFLYIQVHVSTVSGFTPSAGTLQGTLNTAGSLLAGGLAGGTTYYARLVAYNQSLVASAPSGQASASAQSQAGGSPMTGAVLNQNPYFAANGTGGWGSSSAALALNTSPPSPSPAPAAATVTPSAQGGYLYSTAFNVVAGQPYLASAWVYSVTAQVISAGFIWYSPANTVISTTEQAVPVPANTWTVITTVQTAPAGAVTGQAEAKASGSSFAPFIITSFLAMPQVPGTLIQPGTITASQIAAATITAGNIVAGTITAAQIAAGTITANQIGANTITAAKIQAGTITSAQIAAGAITAGSIAAGTITASLLASNIVVAGIVDSTVISGAQFIAHGANGEVLAYTGSPAAGNLLFSVSGAAGSDVPGNVYDQGLQLVALAGLTNLFTIIDTSGSKLAGIDAAGNISGQVITAATDLQVAGKSVSAILAAAAQGVVTRGFAPASTGSLPWPSTAIGTTETAVMELDVTVPAGRSYLLQVLPCFFIPTVSSSTQQVQRLRYTSDGSTPSTSSTEIAGHSPGITAIDSTLSGKNFPSPYMEYIPPTPGSDTVYKFLLSAFIQTAGSSFKYQNLIEMRVTDNGLDTGQLGNNAIILGSGSSGGGGGAQNYTEYFYPVHTYSYYSNSGLRNTDGNMYHGAYSGEAPNYQYSFISWGTGSLGNSLSTVMGYTVSKVALRLSNLRSWYNNGMTVCLHHAATLNGTVSSEDQNWFISEGNTFEVVLTNASYYGTPGTYSVLFPTAGTTDLGHYGYFQGGAGSSPGHPRLTVQYTH